MHRERSMETFLLENSERTRFGRRKWRLTAAIRKRWTCSVRSSTRGTARLPTTGGNTYCPCANRSICRGSGQCWQKARQCSTWSSWTRSRGARCSSRRARSTIAPERENARSKHSTRARKNLLKLTASFPEDSWSSPQTAKIFQQSFFLSIWNGFPRMAKSDIYSTRRSNQRQDNISMIYERSEASLKTMNHTEASWDHIFIVKFRFSRVSFLDYKI